MKRQKRLAVINDLSGFGRCSLTVELPLISALKVVACPFPTAILSVHTAWPDFYLDDYTERMRPYMENWKRNGITFDGVLTGFFGSTEQIQIVVDFLKDFKKDDTMFFFDPVMGDNGRIYPSYTKEMCRAMRELLHHADIVLPNLTEACELLDRGYPAGVISDAELLDMAAELTARGAKAAVVTGVPDEEGDLRIVIHEAGRGSILRTEQLGNEITGTGDAFAAIVSASVLQGEDLTHAVQKAMNFISKTMRYAEEIGITRPYGLPFEEYLTELK
ncbi:pyridoxamine kinase [Selenomonas sp. TAMA-11512]|uniref:pyridoxamine kinase n=1 Tax=Selenomonas sp. TAMA-11512 TaxID=3095337 RepID=UPI003091DB7F|nr:pyridoxamine kinase [Selenomonas sp. TAMA-11512]